MLLFAVVVVVVAIDTIVETDVMVAVEAVAPACILAPDYHNEPSSHRTNVVTVFYVAYLIVPVLPLRWPPTLATYFTDEISLENSAKAPEESCQREGARGKAPEVMASAIDFQYCQGRRRTMMVQIAQYLWKLPTQRGTLV